MRPELSLCIPFHRGPAYLRAAIGSVLAQDDDGWWLDIADDGERGEAEHVVAELDLGGHPRVRCTRNAHNLGMVANWNACLDRAPTPLATLLHADDRLEPGYVRAMRTLAAANPGAVAFFCDAHIIDAAGRERFSFADWIKRFYLPPEALGDGPFAIAGEAALRRLMAGNFIMCPTLCFQLGVLAGRRFDPRHRQVQDLELTSSLLMDGEALIGTREVLYAYRRHAAGATAVQSESLLRFEEELALFDRIADRADTLGWETAARVARRKSIVRLHLAYRAVFHLLRLQPARAARELALAARGAGRSEDGA